MGALASSLKRGCQLYPRPTQALPSGLNLFGASMELFGNQLVEPLDNEQVSLQGSASIHLARHLLWARPAMLVTTESLEA
jgi:hypothetical protein